MQQQLLPRSRSALALLPSQRIAEVSLTLGRTCPVCATLASDTIATSAAGAAPFMRLGCEHALCNIAECGRKVVAAAIDPRCPFCRARLSKPGSSNGNGVKTGSGGAGGVGAGGGNRTEAKAVAAAKAPAGAEAEGTEASAAAAKGKAEAASETLRRRAFLSALLLTNDAPCGATTFQRLRAYVNGATATLTEAELMRTLTLGAEAPANRAARAALAAKYADSIIAKRR